MTDNWIISQDEKFVFPWKYLQDIASFYLFIFGSREKTADKYDSLNVCLNVSSANFKKCQGDQIQWYRELHCKGKQLSICNWLPFFTCGNSWASLSCIDIQYFNLNPYFHENIPTSFYLYSSITFVFIIKFKIWKNNWKLIPAIKKQKH